MTLLLRFVLGLTAVLLIALLFVLAVGSRGTADVACVSSAVIDRDTPMVTNPVSCT